MIFSGGMKLYAVYARPEDGLNKKPVFVREGFNIYAFLFTGLWALYKCLWLPFLLIIAVNILLGYLIKIHFLLKISILVMQFGFNILVGFQGNQWIASRLGRRGYVVVDISAADSLLRAEQRYFERALESPVA